MVASNLNATYFYATQYCNWKGASEHKSDYECEEDLINKDIFNYGHGKLHIISLDLE